MLSVIIPVFQAEKYLNECIESVLSQTYNDLEVILVDDGSTDRSGEICDYYAEKDYRIKVVHKENGGVSLARNAGLEIASGEYITFVDSDDYLETNMYQQMIDIAENYGCDVVMCDCVKDFPDYSIPYTHDIRSGYYDKKSLYEEYYQHLLMMENVEYPATISNWLLLFRRKLQNGKSIPRYLEGVRFSEDLLFGAQLLYSADSFYYMKNQYFYHYRMNPASVTHSFKADKWKDYLKLNDELRRIFGKCVGYDFSHQLDLVLLFFVYNAIGDLRNTNQLCYEEKVQMCKEILQSKVVREMFARLNIIKLPISIKLKIVTFIYKYNIGLKWWIARNN